MRPAITPPLLVLIGLIALGFSGVSSCRSAGEATQASPPASNATGPAWRPGYIRPPVIDIHGHIGPSGLDMLAKTMADSGLSMMVNLSGGGPGRGAETSVEMTRVFPPIVHFYTPNWRARNHPKFGLMAAQGLEVAVRKFGFKGLKIAKVLGLYADLPDGSRMPVDWPGLDPLWAKAGELGVPVAIHTGDPKAFWLPVDEHNERFEELRLHPAWSFHGPDYPSREQLLAERDRMIARHPKTTFICVHFGNNPEDLGDVARLMDAHPNVVVDTAARVGEIGRHDPSTVRAFFIKYRKRILFGTDLGLSGGHIMLGSSGAEEPTAADIAPFYAAHWRFFEGKERGIPHPTPVQGDWTVDALNLPDDVLADIYSYNAMRLLRLPGVPAPMAPTEWVAP